MSDQKKNYDKDPIVLIVTGIIIAVFVVFFVGSVLFGGGDIGRGGAPFQQGP
tara:strand:+ start:408422 stop:408577 length:156 start_codon:yes stop_codon:yes gene_type:complete